VDTGVRGFVYERPPGDPNPHVDHAVATWHLSIAELEADVAFADAITTAANRSIGI
jgi:hypothetical protein